MNSITKNSIHWTYSVAIFCAIFALHQQKATAATLSNGWNYAIDSFNDGVTGGQVGGGDFEFYGIAIKETSIQLTQTAACLVSALLPEMTQAWRQQAFTGMLQPKTSPKLTLALAI